MVALYLIGPWSVSTLRSRRFASIDDHGEWLTDLHLGGACLLVRLHRDVDEDEFVPR